MKARGWDQTRLGLALADDIRFAGFAKTPRCCITRSKPGLLATWQTSLEQRYIDRYYC